ncbi:PH domain-containing protein [Metabacillus niabensis]|uniref:Membrane protein n=1 Tax=Metabacillus niabensis TaxID=324854 RepID=A0ABT9Z5Z2_9BACI|nr:PH domain-containing protein [Metabacillus niabensis]MDQ0227668.1 putative membrane protein [Metabacillus niabensis]
MNKSEKLRNHRLHPISILYFIVTAIKESVSYIWVFPLLVLLVHKQISEHISPFMIIFVTVTFLILLFIVIAILKWQSFTYRIIDGAIYIESGLFVINKRWVHPERIQSIDSTVRVYDHIFSTRTLTIELAGGEESSIILSCISKEEEQRLRRVLGEQIHVDSIDDHFDDSVFQLKNSNLILHSLLSPKFGIVLTIISGALLKYLDVTKETDRETLFTHLSNWLGTYWIVVTILMVILCSFALSLLITFVSDYNFKLYKNSNGDLEIEQGLLEKKRRTVSKNRLQAIIIIEGPLHRLLGYASIKAVIIRNSQDKEGEKTITLLPFVKKEYVQSFLEPFTGYQMINNFKVLTKRAKFHYIVLPGILGSILSIPIWLFLQSNYYVFGILLPIGFLFIGLMSYKMTGWNQGDDFLTLQYGSLSRKTAIIKRGRIQWSSIDQTYFQDKGNLASIRIAVASGKENVKLSLSNIPIEEAETIYQHTLITERS